MVNEGRKDTDSPVSNDDDDMEDDDDDKDEDYDIEKDENYDKDEVDDVVEKDKNYYKDEVDDVVEKDENCDKDENVEEFENELSHYKKFTRLQLINSLIRERRSLKQLRRKVAALQGQQRREKRRLELQNRMLKDLMECYNLKPSDMAILKTRILKAHREKEKTS